MKLRLIEEVDKSQLMTPTVEWMKKKYDEMNISLFDGKLQGCSFEIFKNGKGSQGRILGHFSLKNKLKINRAGHLFKINPLTGECEFVNSENFAEMCNPCIMMNGNYRWTEKAALSTLVHEMCHYYTYRHGFVPKQSHGNEFISIAYTVSSKSKEFFTVQRISSAEKMSEMELDPKIQKTVDKRKETKMNKITVVLIYRQNGDIWLINAEGQDVVKMIINTEKAKTIKPNEIKISDDIELKKILFDDGYKNSMKTYRYWDITNNKSLLEKIKDFEFETIKF